MKLRIEKTIFLDHTLVEIRRNMGFQQDEAPPHNVRNFKYILNEKLRANWLENDGPINWSARLPDICVIDFSIQYFITSKTKFSYFLI